MKKIIGWLIIIFVLVSPFAMMVVVHGFGKVLIAICAMIILAVLAYIGTRLTGIDKL